jgi:hypothetical protein
MSEKTTNKNQLTIIVADQEGDTEEVVENRHTHLDQLLRAGLRKLIGEHADPSEYDLVIDGTPQEDLGKTLEDAGLHDRSEVLIVPKDVSRG